MASKIGEGMFGTIDAGVGKEKIFYCQGKNKARHNEQSFLLWDRADFPNRERAELTCINDTAIQNALVNVADSFDLWPERIPILQELTTDPEHKFLLRTVGTNRGMDEYFLVHKGLERVDEDRVKATGKEIRFIAFGPSEFPTHGAKEKVIDSNVFIGWIQEGYWRGGRVIDITKEILEVTGTEIQQAETTDEDVAGDEPQEEREPALMADYECHWTFYLKSGKVVEWRADDTEMEMGNTMDMEASLVVAILREIDDKHGTTQSGEAPKSWLTARSEHGFINLKKEDISGVELQIEIADVDVEEEDDSGYDETDEKFENEAALLRSAILELAVEKDDKRKGIIRAHIGKHFITAIRMAEAYEEPYLVLCQHLEGVNISGDWDDLVSRQQALRTCLETITRLRIKVNDSEELLDDATVDLVDAQEELKKEDLSKEERKRWVEKESKAKAEIDEHTEAVAESKSKIAALEDELQKDLSSAVSSFSVSESTAASTEEAQVVEA